MQLYRHIYVLTRPNKPDAESAREVGNTGEEVALGDVLAGGLPLLLVLGIPGRKLDLGEDPALRLLDALDLGLLVLQVLLAVGGLGVGGGGGGGMALEVLGLLGGALGDHGLAAADDGRGMLTLVRHVAIELVLCLRWEKMKVAIGLK